MSAAMKKGVIGYIIVALLSAALFDALDNRFPAPQRQPMTLGTSLVLGALWPISFPAVVLSLNSRADRWTKGGC